MNTGIPINGTRWLLALAISILIAITPILGLLAYRAHLSNDLDCSWVLHSVEVKEQLEHLNSLVKEVETGQRGFLLTGNASFLSPYEKALKEIPGQSQNLAFLISDNPRQVLATTHLRMLIADTLAIAAQSLALAQQGKESDAIQIVKNGQERHLEDEIQARVAEMDEEEDQLLTVRENASAAQAKNQDDLMTCLGSTGAALIVCGALLMRRLQDARQKAEAQTDQAHTQTEEANTRTEEAEALGEETIRASELRYRRLFETAQDGILILDADTGQVVDANPFMKELLGYSQEEILGRKLWEIGPFKGMEASKIAFAELQRADLIRYEGLPLETKTGKRVEVEFISNAYLVGRKRLIQCNIRDITERKKLAQQLVLLDTCVSNLSDIVLLTDAATGETGPGIVFVNKAFERLTGYSSAETMGLSPRFLQGEKTDHSVLAEIHAAVEKRQPIRRQLINYRKDGTEFWLDIDIVPIFDAAGKCTHFAAIERDITKTKEIEESLNLFRALMERSPDVIEVIDPQTGRYLDVNETACRRLGYSRQEMLSLCVTDILMTKERPFPLQANVEEIRKTGFKTFESRHRRKDGSTFPIEVNVQYIDLNRGYLVAVVRDITERNRAEGQIAEQAALLDKAQDAILVRDLEGKVLFWNKGAERMYGWTGKEVMGGNVCDFYCPDPQKFQEINEQTLSTGEWHGELQHRTKDGRKISVEGRWTLIRDDEGHAKSVLTINTDITEKKGIEARFLRAQRMESIGTLAGGIAHDLNNVLAPIMMSIEILKDTTDDPQKTIILETIEASARQGADIVRQVLSFARGMEGKRVEVQPKHLLKDLETIIKNTFPKNIRLRFSIPNDTWTILGDPTQVYQVLLNLCVNARDAMPDGGSLTVNVENCVLDEHHSAMSIETKPGRYLHVSVIDSGMGIPQDTVDKIFEPFFTTKDLNKGTGLGLSTVMAIVKSHGGNISVYSEPGKGATFNVYLPSMEMSAEARNEQAAEASMPHGNAETVLVVDDEAAILAITSRTLLAFGYRVLTAADGAEALAIYAQHRREIAMVLTDMSMPVMDGPATIRALKRINPAVKIIAASGLMANGSAINGTGMGVKHFLTKPYTAGTLLKTVRTILDET